MSIARKTTFSAFASVLFNVQKELQKYYNTNLVGNVYQTNLGLNHLLFGGVFENFPS